jgi:aspartyl-tRNA(Asn)/glutamyl-tRNA(Gln) amidotransferase subunit B
MVDDLAYLIDGKAGPWEVVIGLEVHAQVVSESKLFSSAATNFGSAPNSQVSLVDAAMPGMLPVINMECVRQAIRTGLGLNAKINLVSVFDRKNYFYPDLPQGYQISQFKSPVVGEGCLTIELPDNRSKDVGIERLHLEQDAGKSSHDQDPSKTFVDLNRSGIALMEIVSKPDMRSPEEAAAYVSKLRAILRYLGTCDGNMEEGSLRADVNVSVRKPNDPLGTRCEIKNVNSIRSVRLSIEHEARRQVDLIESGVPVIQQTRLFDPDRNETRPMRDKEEAHDYRYFPDPDLLPLIFDQALVNELNEALPELPDAKKVRFIADYKLSEYDAEVLTADRAAADYFENVAISTKIGKNGPKLAANWITSALFGAINEKGIAINDSPVSPSELANLLSLIENGTISGRTAKDVFAEMIDTGTPAIDIVREKGLQQISDTSEIENVIDDLIASNPEQSDQFRSGNDKVAGWFVGQAMKVTGGKANPKIVNELLRARLK